MLKFTNFKTRRRDWGVKRALYWELMHALSKIGVRLHYVRVLAGMLEIEGEEKPEVPPGYEARMVALAEMLPYADSTFGLSRDYLHTAFQRGDRCTANFYHGELVGYSFNAYARARASEQLDVLVPGGFRYSYKAWTHPDHRRVNLSRIRAYTRRAMLPHDHNQRAISFVETHNYPSLLHGYRHPRLRGLPMGFCGWITIFGRQIPFTSRRARWIGFELVRNDDDRRRQYVS